MPHVLKIDKILHYEDSLVSCIDAGELILSGSAEEVEIWAAGVYAVELLVEELLHAGQNITVLELDYLLWNRGQKPSYKVCPRHRTQTVFYKKGTTKVIAALRAALPNVDHLKRMVLNMVSSTVGTVKNDKHQRIKQDSCH